jgi:hypothetical protein
LARLYFLPPCEFHLGLLDGATGRWQRAVGRANQLLVSACKRDNPAPQLTATGRRNTRRVLTEAIASPVVARNRLLAVAAGGVLSGVLTPLLPQLIDRISGSPGDFKIALVAIPFAILVFSLVWRFSANPWWAALMAAIITMIAFACAVNAAIWIDGQANDASKVVRNILAGLAGGFTGAIIMALGIGLLPAGPRDVVAWLPMLITGTIAGALLALDNALGLDLTSLLYPVWQAGVTVVLVIALRRTRSSLDVND